MPPIDEFENDLKRTRPRPLSPSAIAAVETKLRDSESQQRPHPPRLKTSRAALVGVWSSGFAIGAAAMFLVAPWIGTRPEQSAPSVPVLRPQQHEEHASIAATPDAVPVKRLVSYPAWSRHERPYPRVPEVLTVGSDLSTMADWPETPVSLRGIPEHDDATIPDEIRPDRYRSRTPKTRRELIDQILNEV